MAASETVRSIVEAITPAMLVAAPVALEAVEHIPPTPPPAPAVVAAAPLSPQSSRAAPRTAAATSSEPLSIFSIEIGQGAVSMAARVEDRLVSRWAHDDLDRVLS